jgi:hypothetical protein
MPGTARALGGKKCAYERIESSTILRRSQITLAEHEHIGNLGNRPRDLISINLGEILSRHQADDQIKRDPAGSLVGQQFVDDPGRMPKTRGFDQNAIGSRGGDELIEIATKIRFTGTAETTTRYEPYIEWASRGRCHRQRIDTRIGEFIEENDPVLSGGLIRYEL